MTGPWRGANTVRQRGVTLLLCVLLLAGLSLLALSAASDSQLQLRVMGNIDSEARALAAARSAGAWAEQWLFSLDGASPPPTCASDCTGAAPILAPGALPQHPGDHPENWWLSQAFADGHDPFTGQRLAPRAVRGTPVGRWLVQELHRDFVAAEQENPSAELVWYRVIARAAPAPSGSPVVVESIVARPWGEAGWQDALPRDAALTAFCQSLVHRMPCGRRGWRRR